MDQNVCSWWVCPPVNGLMSNYKPIQVLSEAGGELFLDSEIPAEAEAIMRGRSVLQVQLYRAERTELWPQVKYAIDTKAGEKAWLFYPPQFQELTYRLMGWGCESSTSALPPVRSEQGVRDRELLAGAVMEDSFVRADAKDPKFRRFFENLPQAKKGDINAMTEEYESYAVYLERMVTTSGMNRILTEELSTDALNQESIVNETVNRIQALFLDPKMRMNAYANKQIAATLKRLETVLKIAFDIKASAHRPVDKMTEELHRKWSRQMYLGVSSSKLAKQYNLDEDHIKKSVERNRKRRETSRDQWLLRAAICRKLKLWP
jgi:hypothetical protein